MQKSFLRIRFVKKNECGIYKKINSSDVWGYTDSSNKEVIYPYTFLYIRIILTYRFIYFYLSTIGKKKLLWKIQYFHLSHSLTRD